MCVFARKIRGKRELHDTWMVSQKARAADWPAGRTPAENIFGADGLCVSVFLRGISCELERARHRVRFRCIGGPQDIRTDFCSSKRRRRRKLAEPSRQN